MHETHNPFRHQRSKPRIVQAAAFWVYRLATYLIIAAALFIFGNIFIKGGRTVFRVAPPFINVEFLTQSPETLYVFQFEGKQMELGDKAYREFAKAHPEAKLRPKTYAHSGGGIFPCIVGSVILVAGAMIIAMILGIAAAIYLSEYSQNDSKVRFVRLAIMNLAGVPSIVFGLFGLGMFVLFLNWNVSLLAGWFTLATLVLPVIITASEESLRAVPMGLRESALALGATKWQTIRTNVLPYALPGIMTSSILGIARVAGETAPIMFTAAYVLRDKLPWQVDRLPDFFFQGVMALPYHIYVVSSKIPQNEYTERVQFGTAFVFLVLVFAIALTSILVRARMRARLKW